MAIIELPSLSSYGLTNNVTNYQNATILAYKVRFLVDDMASITAGNSTTVFQFGNTTGGNVIKFALGISNVSTGVSQIHHLNPGFGGTQFNVNNSALPALGSYVSIYGWYDNAAGTQGLYLFDASGNVLASSSLTSYFPGALPTSANTGILQINKGYFDAGTHGSGILHIDAIAFYTLENTTTAFQWAQPTSSDGNRLAYWNCDEGSGTISTDAVASNVITWTTPTWLAGGIWDPGTSINPVGQQYSYIQGTAVVNTNTVQVTTVGQQENYQIPGGVAGVDINAYPTTQTYAWLVGTASTSIQNNQNPVINPTSQVYHWLTGVATLSLTTFVNAVGQQVNWKLGNPIIQTTTSATVTTIGQQYSYYNGTPLVQITSAGNPVVIVPAPGSGFVIEGCPMIDTGLMVESECGQSTTPQLQRWDGTIMFDGSHSWGGM